MSDTVNVPKKLYKDKRLKDFDKVLYLHIEEHVNEDGYSVITNDTLAYLTGKKETAIKDSINRLVKHKYIVKKLNVKPNEKYPQSFKRVLWKEHNYSSWRYGLKRERERERNRSIENDKKLFIAWLRTDCRGIQFPVEIGGLTQKYVIELADNGKWLMFVYPTGEDRVQLQPSQSQEVYDKMWAKREVVFKALRTKAKSKSVEELEKMANEKNEDSQE